jgi:hypothetical protein
VRFWPPLLPGLPRSSSRARHRIRARLFPIWINALGNEVPVERALRQTVGAGNSGSFQFSGLATCWYALRATAPGWAPAYDGPFLLGGAGSDGGEVIHHLVLRRPVWAEIAVTPPLDPHGRPWHVVLGLRPIAPALFFTAERVASSLHGGDLDEAGHWSQTGLAPGVYEAAVSSSGDSYGIWARQDFDIGAGGGKLVFRIPSVEVEGRLSGGLESVQGTLYFSQSNAGGLGFFGAKIDSGSGERFRGTLPREGTWCCSSRPGVAAGLSATLKPPSAKLGAGPLLGDREARARKRAGPPWKLSYQWCQWFYGPSSRTCPCG